MKTAFAPKLFVGKKTPNKLKCNNEANCLVYTDGPGYEVCKKKLIINLNVTTKPIA